MAPPAPLLLLPLIVLALIFTGPQRYVYPGCLRPGEQIAPPLSVAVLPEIVQRLMLIPTVDRRFIAPPSPSALPLVSVKSDRAKAVFGPNCEMLSVTSKRREFCWASTVSRFWPGPFMVKDSLTANWPSTSCMVFGVLKTVVSNWIVSAPLAI